jgi:hypothetical protein
MRFMTTSVEKRTVEASRKGEFSRKMEVAPRGSGSLSRPVLVGCPLGFM